MGCGTGFLLRLLADRLPEAERLLGIDAAAGMIAVAKSKANDPRLSFSEGVAEKLPYPDESFDLVVSSTSFDHWEVQGAGLSECGRVLAPGGHLVLTDLFSPLLVPTLLGARRDRAPNNTSGRGALEVRRVSYHGMAPSLQLDYWHGRGVKVKVCPAEVPHRPGGRGHLPRPHRRT